MEGQFAEKKALIVLISYHKLEENMRQIFQRSQAITTLHYSLQSTRFKMKVQ